VRTLTELPIFTVDDIPDDWWIRLNDKLVDELDQLNRPYKYGLSKRRIARYWEAGELHKRTLEKMTEEEVAGYKRRHSFFEKLWGRHRFKDYHFPKGDPRRYVDTGPWIEKSEISVLREGIDIDDENLNKAITGFRVGKFSDNVREVKVKQLPIIANKQWAWLFGFYFGAGNIYLIEDREYERNRKGGYDSIYVRIRVKDALIPKVLSVSTSLGLHAVNYQVKDKFRGKGKGNLGVGTRDQIVFGWPEYVIMKKFGLPTEILEVKNRNALQLAASNYKPIIPEWILKDDAFMKDFIEGYMNTGKFQTTLQIGTQTSGRKFPVLALKFSVVGYPQEYVKKFSQEIHLWFTRQGIIPGYRNTIPSGENRYNYVLHITALEDIKFIKDNFSLTPQDKARIYVRLEADEDQVIYEALRTYGNPENVVLGCLLEQPLTAEDIAYDLSMYPEKAEQTLNNLVEYGLAREEIGVYYYDPKEFTARTIQLYKYLSEEKQQRMAEFSDQLLYQCGTCREVYIRPLEKCEICGNGVHSVHRKSVLRRLNTKSRYDLILARKLEEEK